MFAIWLSSSCDITLYTAAACSALCAVSSSSVWNFLLVKRKELLKVGIVERQRNGKFVISAAVLGSVLLEDYLPY